MVRQPLPLNSKHPAKASGQAACALRACALQGPDKGQLSVHLQGGEPDGLPLRTLDSQSFLVLNGVQKRYRRSRDFANSPVASAWPWSRLRGFTMPFCRVDSGEWRQALAAEPLPAFFRHLCKVTGSPWQSPPFLSRAQRGHRSKLSIGGAAAV